LIGNGGWQFNEVFTGSIDLNETSIKGYFLVNGEYAQQTRKMSDGTYVLEKQNVNVVGSPTIENNIVSGFSSSNYLSLEEPFNPEGAWEIVLKLKRSGSGQQFLLGSIDSYYKTLGGELQPNNTLAFGLTSDGYSWDIAWFGGNVVLEENVWYWVKLSFTGSEYKYELSTNGKDYNLVDSVTSSTPLYCGDDSIMNIGTMGGRHNYWNGSIDLSKSYIKFNGKKTYLFGSVVEELYGITDGVFSTSQIAYCYVNRDKTLVVRKTKTENLDTSDWYLGEVYLKLGLPNPDLDV
jgi:hypothetical protein